MILHAYLFIFLTNFWVYHFFHLCDVFHGSGSFQWIQTDVFSCPGDPRTIPDWSWIDLEKVIFSWKFSKFWVTWVSLLPKKLICISKPWTIWEYPDLEQLKTQKPNEAYQILTDRCWEKQKTKLKNVLNQVTKISRKFSIRGNYSWAYLL